MKKTVVLIIILIIFGFGAYKTYNAITQKSKLRGTAKTGERKVPVTVAAVIQKNLFEKIALIGELKPLLRSEISAKITGQIESVNVNLGDFVNKDFVLINLDDREYIEQYNNSQISYKLALVALEKQELETDNLKKQYERTLELYKNNLASKESLENSETKYRTAAATLRYNRTQVEQEKNRVAQANINLNYTKITAPFSGFIEKINVDRGALATQGKSILTLVDISKIKIEVDISERYYPYMKTGLPVNFTTGVADNIFNGTITNISPTINIDNRSAKIEITVNNKDYFLKSGMTAKVNIILRSFENMTAIPLEALYKINDKTGVFIIKDDDTAEFIQAEPKVIDDNFAGFDATAGLRAGQKVILYGGHLIKTGDKIAIDGGSSRKQKTKDVTNPK